MRPPHDRETDQLITSLRSRRRRRKTARIVLALLVLVLIIGAITTGVVLATRSPGTETLSTVTSSVEQASDSAGSTTSSETPKTTKRTTTTERTPATEPPVTLAPVTTKTPASTTTSSAGRLTGEVVAIDPGHQAHANSDLEPIGPGSSKKKAKVSGGTASPTTGTPESEVTLAVGLKLRDALEELGIKVVMTRTTEDVDIPNSKRAKMANDADADLAVRLHCNGSTDRSVHGLFTLYPASIKGWTDDIAVASKKAAVIIQRTTIAATDAKDRGLQQRSDLSGFNWSDVPSVLVEMGYMTNAAEDGLLESGSYQDKIVKGMVAGIVEFLEADR